jgi:hypothetical protein
MENKSYKIISFLEKKYNPKKISIIYDTINERIIEKWECYKLLHYDSKFVITDRIIYSYNKFGNINKILEIVKGPDDRMYKYLNDDNEYCHSINRKISYTRSSYRTFKTEIIYTRNNHIGSNRRKHFLRSLLLEVDDNSSKNSISIRLKYLRTPGKLYTYEYCKDNFNELKCIIEYDILLDLRIINKIFSIIGETIEFKLFMSIPDLFVKKKIKKQFVESANKIHEMKIHEQDYYSSIYDENPIFINDIIFKEDIFMMTQNDLNNEYEAASSGDTFKF